jgi:hypothetical protein
MKTRIGLFLADMMIEALRRNERGCRDRLCDALGLQSPEERTAERITAGLAKVSTAGKLRRSLLLAR